MKVHNHTTSSDISFIDDLYNKFKSDPKSVDITWQKFFEGFEFADDNSLGSVKFTESSVSKLIESYRKYGHLNSLTNPVRTRRDHNIKFDLDKFDLSEGDLFSTFFTIPINHYVQILRNISQHRNIINLHFSNKLKRNI